MGFVGNLISGLGIALSPWNLVYCLIGVFLGTLIGVLPGLGSSATIAMLLPITYKLHPTTAIIMLAGIYYGAQYGGSTTSILINIPGEGTSIVTCLDGYQMARKGRAGVALGVSAIGSFIAGTLSIFGLSLFAPLLSDYALRFGPAEYFSLVLAGIIMAVYLSQGSVLKALTMGALGFLLSTVGHDPLLGKERFTFGLTKLTDGFDFLSVVMGLFGISEVIINLESPEIRDVFKTSLKQFLPSWADWNRCWASVMRGSVLGFFIGVLPGAGPLVASFASYAVEKRVSKHPEEFGKGAIEGVAAPESANNAAATSSFVPLLTLGIPGNPAIAMIFVALMIHGIRPGPLLLQEHPDLFWGVVASMYIGNVMLLALNLPLIGLWVRVLKVQYGFLAAIIVAVCFVGSYSLNSSTFDLWTMLAFGMFGYLARKIELPLAPLVLTMILGPLLERSLQQSLIAFDGNPLVFFTRPISAAILLTAGLLTLKSFIGRLWKLVYSIKGGKPG